MKQRKHRHKESFSILLISNTGQRNRQFHVSLFIFRLLIILLLLICAALAWYTYWFLTGHRDETALREQIISQTQMIQQLEEEKETLNKERLALKAENDALRLAAQVNTEAAKVESESVTEPEADSSIPSRYPCSEQGALTAMYSDDHPYLSIHMQAEGSIIAAGDGTVAAIGSDNAYPLIIEVDHGNGYRTRYMCLQTAEGLPEEGTQIQIGDILVNIGANTQLDYQVMFEGQPIDPLMVLDAKG